MDKKGIIMVKILYVRRMNGDIGTLLLPSDPKTPRNNRGKCNAKTRKGSPCKAPPVWDGMRDGARNGRCKLHGGLSTGARTEKGREAIRESNRKRTKSRHLFSG